MGRISAIVIREYCLFLASWCTIFDVIRDTDPIMNKLIYIKYYTINLFIWFLLNIFSIPIGISPLTDLNSLVQSIPSLSLASMNRLPWMLGKSLNRVKINRFCDGNNCTMHQSVGIFSSWNKILILDSISFIVELLSNNIFLSELNVKYFSLSTFYSKHMNVTRVWTNSQPVGFSTQHQTIDGCKLISPSNLMYHLSSPRIKDSNLNTLLWCCY